MSCKSKTSNMSKKLTRSKADLSMMGKFNANGVQNIHKNRLKESYENFSNKVNMKLKPFARKTRENFSNMANMPLPVRPGRNVSPTGISPTGISPEIITGPPVVIPRTDSDWDERTMFDDKLQKTWCPYRGWIPVDTSFNNTAIETPHSLENFKNYKIRSYPYNYPKEPTKDTSEGFMVYQQKQMVPPINAYLGTRSKFDIEMNKKWDNVLNRTETKENFKGYLMSFGDPDNSWSYTTQSFNKM